MLTNINDLDLTKTYTYADYLTWRFKERVELIMGKVFKMTPAPSRTHQQVSSRLHVAIGNILKGTNCEIYSAPFDVRLAINTKGEGIGNTVVQPDLCVICDKTKLDERGCNGAPELVVEILSPSTASKDLKEKYNVYEKGGVKEYWTIDPIDGIISIYVLNNKGEFTFRKPYTVEDSLESQTISGLMINLKDVFPQLLEESQEPYGSEEKRI